MEQQRPTATITDRLHLLATLLVAGLYALVLYQLVVAATAPPTPDWQLPALILLAAVNTLTAMARQLQWQYVLTAALFASLIGSAAHLLSAHSGIPFGPFLFGPAAGSKIFNELPWVIPFIWLVALFNSRGVARLILRPWRKMKTYGFWLIGVTAGLVTLFDLGMDPFLSRVNRYWLWSHTKFPVTWAEAPVINFLGWLFVTLLILAFATPVLIKKQPGQKSTPDYHPLIVWLGAMALFAVAAGRHELWWVVGVDVAAMVAAAVQAIRGARW